MKEGLATRDYRRSCGGFTGGRVILGTDEQRLLVDHDVLCVVKVIATFTGFLGLHHHRSNHPGREIRPHAFEDRPFDTLPVVGHMTAEGLAFFQNFDVNAFLDLFDEARSQYRGNSTRRH